MYVTHKIGKKSILCIYLFLEPVPISYYYILAWLCGWRYIQGENKQTNKKLESPSGGQAPYSTGFPLLCECSRNPSVLVCQLVLLWEAVFGFSDFFFKKTLSTGLPILWRVIYKHMSPHRAECSAVFDQKQHDACAPPSLFTWPTFCFLFPRFEKKSSKRKILPMWKRWNKEENWQKQWKTSKLMSSKMVLSSG